MGRHSYRNLVPLSGLFTRDIEIPKRISNAVRAPSRRLAHFWAECRSVIREPFDSDKATFLMGIELHLESAESPIKPNYDNDYGVHRWS
jgi:hypothetical protein